MFILTIDSKDPVKIADALRSLANSGIEQKAIGYACCASDEDVQFEYEICQQNWPSIFPPSDKNA